MGEKMDRGTDALKSHISSISKMDVRQVSACVCVWGIKYCIIATQEAPHTSEKDDTSYSS